MNSILPSTPPREPIALPRHVTPRTEQQEFNRIFQRTNPRNPSRSEPVERAEVKPEQAAEPREPKPEGNSSQDKIETSVNDDSVVESAPPETPNAAQESASEPSESASETDVEMASQADATEAQAANSTATASTVNALSAPSSLLATPPLTPEALAVQQAVAQTADATQVSTTAQELPTQVVASAQLPSTKPVQTAVPAAATTENVLGVSDESSDTAQTGTQGQQSNTSNGQANAQASTLPAAFTATTPNAMGTAQLVEVATPATASGNTTANNANAVPTTTLQLPQGATAEDQANVGRVMRGLQSAVNQNGGQVNLRLNPPELGIVRIQLEIVQQTVKVNIHTEADSVRQLMTHQLAQLRQGLESQGLSVERISVQTTGSNASQSNASSEQDTDGRSRGFNQRRDSNGSQDNNDQPQGKDPSKLTSFFDFLTGQDNA